MGVPWRCDVFHRRVDVRLFLPTVEEWWFTLQAESESAILPSTSKETLSAQGCAMGVVLATGSRDAHNRDVHNRKEYP